MSNDPDLLDTDPPCAGCGDDVGPVEYLDTGGRRLCADCIQEDQEEEEEPTGWVCFLCDYRSPGMTLADLDTYNAHVAEHGRRLAAARIVANAARAKNAAGQATPNR